MSLRVCQVTLRIKTIEDHSTCHSYFVYKIYDSWVHPFHLTLNEGAYCRV